MPVVICPNGARRAAARRNVKHELKQSMGLDHRCVQRLWGGGGESFCGRGRKTLARSATVGPSGEGCDGGEKGVSFSICVLEDGDGVPGGEDGE